MPVVCIFFATQVSVTLTTPPLSGRYIGYWRLRTADGQNFGHRVWADVLVTGGTASLIDEGTMVSGSGSDFFWRVAVRPLRQAQGADYAHAPTVPPP